MVDRWPLVARVGFGYALHAAAREDVRQMTRNGPVTFTVLVTACGKDNGVFLSSSAEGAAGPSCRSCLRKLARQNSRPDGPGGSTTQEG